MILHADLDCFFAAAETLDFPELAGKPVAVGGSPDGRGVVAACNYEARKFGLHSAMAMARAIRLCPHVIIRRGRYDRYRELSDMVFDIFHRFTPAVQGISIDEAFLDVTGSRRLHGDGLSIARALRALVLAETGLIVSVGVAPNKFVAKLSSDLEKPDGLTVAPFDPAELTAWLAPLPIRRMWGVGPAAEIRLKRHGFHTFGDLQLAGADRVLDRLGEYGLQIRERAFGRDARVVNIERDRAKSVSHETTFPRDVSNREELRSVLSALADKVAGRVRKQGLVGRCVMVKIRFPDFRTITRNRTLRVPTAETEPLFTAAWEMLDANVPEGQPLRLIGVAMQALDAQVSPGQTKSLFDQLDESDNAQAGRTAEQPVDGRAVDSVIDRIRLRLGAGTICRGRDLQQPEFPSGTRLSSEESGYRKDRDDH